MRPLPLASLIAVAVALVAAVPANAAVVGVATDTTWGLSTADMDRTIEMERAAGVRWVRESASWTAMERDGKGQWNSNFIANIDAAIDRDVAAGLNVVMYIDQVPYWASADPNKHVDSSGTKRWNKNYKPANMQDYADFVRWVVQRYSARGVKAFEIWNEPNHKHFWPSGPNVGEYMEMLRAGYTAAKEANPNAIVMMAGLSPDGAVPLYDYLAGMYRAGAASYTDRVNVHLYPSDDPTRCWNDGAGRPHVKALCGLSEMQRIATAAGDGGKRFWITEIGYSTCGEVSSSCWGFTEAQQADYLTKAYRKLESDYPNVEIAFWYQFRNLYWQNDPASWNGNLGLVRQDFTPKPAYEALRAYATAAPSEPPPPTTEEPPPTTEEPPPTTEEPPPPAPLPDLGVSLTSPLDASTFTTTIAMAANATGSVAKVDFLFDGKRIASDSSAPYATTYRVRKNASYGPHTVTAVVHGTAGGSARTSVTVTRVRSTATASRRCTATSRRAASRSRRTASRRATSTRRATRRATTRRATRCTRVRSGRTRSRSQRTRARSQRGATRTRR